MNLFLVIFSTYLVYVDYAHGYETGINLYSFRYSTLDLDTILNSDRLVTNYVDCLLNRKPCSPEGKELKRLLPEALRTKCAKCSNRQKEGALKVLKKLYISYPKHYNDLRKKWDPTGEYHRRFEEYLREEQFNAIPNERPGSYDYDKDQTQVKIQRLPPQQQPQNTKIPIAVPLSSQQFPQTTSIPIVKATKSATRATQSTEQPSFSIDNRFSEDDIGGSADSVALMPAASATPDASILSAAGTSINLPTTPPCHNPKITTPPNSSKIVPTLSTISTSAPDELLSSSVDQIVQSSSVSTEKIIERATNANVSDQLSSPPVIVIKPSLNSSSFLSNITLPNESFIIKNNRPNVYAPPTTSLQPPNTNPFLFFINRIGNKITSTADLIAEMLRSTVKIS